MGIRESGALDGRDGGVGNFELGTRTHLTDMRLYADDMFKANRRKEWKDRSHES